MADAKDSVKKDLKLSKYLYFTEVSSQKCLELVSKIWNERQIQIRELKKSSFPTS